ncbi:MAG TPA: AAA family ATPase [Oculatellaceae cyanobacterium]|jgi:hypothetical protein
MKLDHLNLLADSWSQVISIQSQQLERTRTLGWIDLNFASPRNLPVFFCSLGQSQFKQVRYFNDTCYIKATSLSQELIPPGDDCLQILDFVSDCSFAGVFVLENLQSLMVNSKNVNGVEQERTQKIIAKLVNIFYEFKVTEVSKYLLLLSTNEADLPEQLVALIPHVRNPLPTLKEISNFLSNFLPGLLDLGNANSNWQNNHLLSNADIDSLSIAASGLSIEEIKIGLRMGVNEKVGSRGDSLPVPSSPYPRSADTHGGSLPSASDQGTQLQLKEFLLDYKVERLRGYGLDFIGKPNVPDFGGLDLLKVAIKEVKADYSPKARTANIPLPKGWLLVGPPGTGKTLAAKVIARELGFPLLCVDVGAIASQGAAYLRQLIDRVEACAPAVIYFDEFDKLFLASSDTGEDTGARAILGLLLTWLQEKQSATFAIATLNRLKALPPELTRIGRFDEIFYVGFPQAVERQQIVSLHAARFDERYKYGDSPLTESEWKIFLGKTMNCTGAELQKIVEKAARKLFYEGRPVKIGLNELLETRATITPLYVRDPDRVLALENEARYITSPASSEDLSIYAPPLRTFWGEQVNGDD